MRSYGQYCPVAVALDVVGDRWTLLILRELLMGERRFTDLRVALPGLAPNLLTERLRELEAGGLVERRELPPPIARTVYAATADGRATAPVLQALARYGATRLGLPGEQRVRPSMAVFGMLVPFHRADGGRLHVRLDVDGETFDLVSDNGVLSTRSRPDLRPDVVVSAPAAEIAAARTEGRALASAKVSGTAADRRRFARVFDLGAGGLRPRRIPTP
ncbi:MAG: winged helix-turn-helix transcriptional regulator [Ilumatobacteraceae bacterium]